MPTADEPELHLDPHEGRLDLGIDPEELPKLPPFGELTSLEGLDPKKDLQETNRRKKLAAKLVDNANMLILRRFKPNDVICTQGDPGGTAYYILDRDELPRYQDYFQRALAASENGDGAADEPERNTRRAHIQDALDDIGKVIASWREEIERRQTAAPPSEPPPGPSATVTVRLPVMEVFLDLPGARDQIPWVRKLWNGLRFGRTRASADTLKEPLMIKIDGPRDLLYKRPKDDMFEGELFGEMSCLNRAPRSATVRATRDCYVLEMLPYLFDQLVGNPTFKARLDKAYSDRYLVLHLREHDLLSHFNNEQLAEVREQVKLVDFKPGEIIYDEHERGHGMHLIRSGIVKVVKNASFLIDPRAITRPDELAGAIRSGAKPAGDLVKDVAELLPQASRDLLAAVLDAQDAELAGALAAADSDRASRFAPFWDYLSDEDRKKKGSAELATLRESALRGLLADILNEAIKADRLRTLEPLRALARSRKIGLRVWLALTDASNVEEPDVRKCQRYWLSTVYGNALPELSDKAVEARNFHFLPDQIKDGPKTALALAGADARKHPLKARVYQLLPESACAALERILKAAEAGKADEGAAPGAKLSAAEMLAKRKAAKAAAPKDAATPPAGTPAEAPAPVRIDPDIALVTDALNNLNLLIEEPWLLLPNELLAEVPDSKFVEKFLAAFRVYLLNQRAWVPYDTDQAVRATGRLLLEDVFPNDLAPIHKRADLPRTLAYRSGREFIGEIGLFEGVPRGATCVAYNHPKGSSDRPDAPVRLVHIPEELFRKLLLDPEFRKKVEIEVEKRHRRDAKSAAVSPTAGVALRLDSLRAEDLGLIQGQALMVIDLDRCTRCDECVRACVNAHDDGRSRLYLDGPRFGSFLVPSTCRSCMDPVCMAGCPVSSIQRGPLNEMIIRDWCIGCEKCATQCPYGSIQMHEQPSAPREDKEAEHGKPAKSAKRAVVCDLCRSLDGGPACVAACPHEAASRINAPLRIAGGRVGL